MAKILIIEQTNMLKLRLEKLFVKMGYSEVISYQIGVISFENFLSNLGEINSIVIDYDQYKSEFEKLMKYLNERGLTQSIKTILLTSKVDVNEMMKFFTKGVDEVILKPFGDDVLYEKLKRELELEVIQQMYFVKETIKGGGKVLSWCKDFEIGVEEIDNEHKDIIEHFEKLYVLMKEGQGHEYYMKLMKFLEYYVNTHFQHEEALQVKLGYSGYNEHKVLHQAFKAQVELMISQNNKSNVSNADVVKLNLFIKEWLIHHILIEDKKIAAYINKL